MRSVVIVARGRVAIMVDAGMARDLARLITASTWAPLRQWAALVRQISIAAKEADAKSARTKRAARRAKP